MKKAYALIEVHMSTEIYIYIIYCFTYVILWGVFHRRGKKSMCSYEGNPTKAFASLSTVDTPLKFNMETQNKSLEKEILFWKPAFSGCILNFVCVYIYIHM